MAELTVDHVVFTLKQLQVNFDAALLRRVEWSLGDGNHKWPEERLKEELSSFVLRNSRSRNLAVSGISLNDFLCEKGISLGQYRQFARSLNTSSHQASFLNTATLERFDVDSSILTFDQHRPELDAVLEGLRELGLSHIQCRAILGIGTKSYEKLKKQMQEQRKGDISRTGRSENDPWSFAKHVVSELCLRLFKELSSNPPLILETHQGLGDASSLYRHHGHVLGFDNNKDVHQKLIERSQIGGFYRNVRDLYMQRPSPDVRTTGPYFFLADEAIPCEQGLRSLIKQGLQFDVVDIDPWKTSRPYFQDALNVLSDSGLVMVTLGDQQPWPKGETQAWESFGIDLYNDLLADDVKRIWRRTWMFQKRACAWYMRTSIAHSFCLLPIILMRNLEPWSSREDFPNGVSGIDRIYFLAKRVFDIDRLERVFQSWTEPLPIFFDEVMLRREILSYTGSSGTLNFVSFTDDIWPVMKPFWSTYHEWLVATSNDLLSRWRYPEPSDIVETRYRLQQAIEKACKEKVVNGLQLAAGWLRNV